jgi:putative GTP pyrophosphokinase
MAANNNAGDYTERDVNASGQTLRDPAGSAAERAHALVVLSSWRAAHGHPLNVLSLILAARLRELGIDGLLASRLKRVPTMLDKLRRIPRLSLWELQDIGGLRVVLETPAQVDQFVNELIRLPLGGFDRRGDVRDHVASPPSSGYRSKHLVFSYLTDPADDIRLHGLTVELQVRTRLQHAWATANEVVGTFIRQPLKSSKGNPAWLRFFNLAGAVIARDEGLPLGQYVPTDPGSLDAEFAALKTTLNVYRRVKGYAVADLIADRETSTGPVAHYVLTADLKQSSVLVHMFGEAEFSSANAMYEIEEFEHIGDPDFDVVLVSVDSLNDLRATYQNYFADTQTFLNAVFAPMERMAINADIEKNLPHNRAP